jgi:hypothetical protein
LRQENRAETRGGAGLRFFAEEVRRFRIGREQERVLAGKAAVVAVHKMMRLVNA